MLSWHRFLIQVVSYHLSYAKYRVLVSFGIFIIEEPKLMHYSDFKLLTFDVVGTLIDFEAGILGFINELG